eukprot:2799576-Pyramimonas_sp.AAC.1
MENCGAMSALGCIVRVCQPCCARACVRDDASSIVKSGLVQAGAPARRAGAARWGADGSLGTE